MDANHALPNCSECLNPFKIFPDCIECKDQQHSFPNCSECIDSRHAFPNCSECLNPRQAFPNCSECEDASQVFPACEAESLILIVGGSPATSEVEVVSPDPVSNPVPECLKSLSNLPTWIYGAVGTTFGRLK